MDNLDKFYTHPDIAKMFVDKINEICPLDDFDMVLEPSAGSGHILKYLPDSAIGMDIKPTDLIRIGQKQELGMIKFGTSQSQLYWRQ